MHVKATYFISIYFKWKLIDVWAFILTPIGLFVIREMHKRYN